MTPAQELLERFQRYLVSERGIGAATAESYACFVRPFAEARLGPGGPGLEGLTRRGCHRVRGRVLPGHAEGVGEDDGDLAAVTAGLAARRRGAQPVAGLGGAVGRRLAAGPAAAAAGPRPGRRRCWTAATGPPPTAAGTWRC